MAPGVGVATSFGALLNRRITAVDPGLLELYVNGRFCLVCDQGMGPYPYHVRRNPDVIPTSSISHQPWCWDFHTVRGGIDPGDRRFVSLEL